MKQEKKISWFGIIMASIFFFPVGIYLALKKLHSEPQNYEKNAKGVSTYAYVWIGFGVLSFFACLSGSEETPGSLDTALFALFTMCAFGVPILLNANKYKKMVKTYKKYATIIGSVGGSIDNIASECGTTYDVALKNIETFIDKGLLYGRVDLASRSYINSAYNPNPQQNTTYSQPRVSSYKKIVKCPNCGANNEISEDGGICEFCGSPIK